MRRGELFNNPYRRKIIEYLAAKGAARVSDLIRELGLSKANASWHLDVLSRHGIVGVLKVGKASYAFMNNEKGFTALLELLASSVRGFCQIVGRGSSSLSERDLMGLLDTSYDSAKKLAGIIASYHAIIPEICRRVLA
ncbi:winged helix-turn-helix domain-containing protein [Thermogladius sp. 4427co]|uniref:winged helix-turn-helix domain-containing protein n=1 Tax=Thermogladius sp. 4427co TaxID=3450718 RepID=UPI003F78E1B9